MVSSRVRVSDGKGRRSLRGKSPEGDCLTTKILFLLPTQYSRFKSISHFYHHLPTPCLFFSPDFRKITLPAGERRKGPLSHPKFWGPCSWVYREQNTCQMGIWSPWLVTCIWARENTFLASFVDCWRGFLSNLFVSRTFISHSIFTVYPGTVCWTAATYISCLLQPHSGS